MMPWLTVAMLTTAASLTPTLAGEDLDQAMTADVLLRAMVDELHRSQQNLVMEDLPRPYFIEYALADGVYCFVGASLGAVTQQASGPLRPFRTDVRVGSYELDNTNFAGGRRSQSGSDQGATMPFENDYDAIRQAIWWVTDLDCKQVTEDLVRKKAFMQSKLIEDKPDDLSREAPCIQLPPRVDWVVDDAELAETAAQVSGVFREYAGIQDSNVNAGMLVLHKYLVNSEGTRMRVPSAFFSVEIVATVQAEDGMPLSATRSFRATRPDDQPPMEDMISAARSLADDLLKLKDAQTLDTYAGPVLFDAPAAAAIFARHFGGRFPGGQRSLGSRAAPDDFANKLNQRILPRSVTVVDDPTLETIGATRAFGHYAFDDQGVPARAVTLVEKGRLVAQLMSRNPSKEFSHSTGHGRGLYAPRASIANLVFSTTDGLTDAELREELLSACEDEGLPFGIRVASLGNVGRSSDQQAYLYVGRAYDPLMVYKVYADGREELVRGGEISGLNLKAFKRMLAMGDSPYVLHGGGTRGGPSWSVAAPAMLFEELDLAKIDRDFDRPPILDSPLARKAADDETKQPGIE